MVNKYTVQELLAKTVPGYNVDLTTSTVSQATNATTAVDLPASYGIITTQAFSTVANGSTTFAINHESIAPGKLIFVDISKYEGPGLPLVYVNTINTNTADVLIVNHDRTLDLDGTMEISYAIVPWQ